uniref:C2H2-type domain-containing protein n=1 Tax=Kalanchoe fedtschenkoi TaxID=63787 RepID=A0A7N0V3X1_KALFE
MEDHQQKQQQQLKHVCKLCCKGFPCGRSLGGHMRSHGIMNSASDTTDAIKFRERNLSSLVNIGENSGSDKLGFEQNSQNSNTHTSYGLRENPKKTSRFARLSEPVITEGGSDEKLCKLCGKGFASSKALFGHMKCHSEKVVINSSIEEENSSQSDRNDEDDVPHLRRRSSRKMKSDMTPVAGTLNTLSSNLSFATASCSDAGEIEQEDVARSLMMLSRDSWANKEFSSDVEVSEKDKASLRSKAKCRIQNGVKMKQPEILTDKIYSSKKLIYDMDEPGFSKRASKRNKFQCATCNKVFHSYQALGGHRASHKKIKGCFASNFNQAAENSSEHDRSAATLTESNLTTTERQEIHDTVADGFKKGKSKDHECPICFKIFSSGQALGGHKRSHLLGSADMNTNQSIVIEEPMTKMIDLNLPAPTEDETANQVNDFTEPWWALGSCSKPGPLIGFSL